MYALFHRIPPFLVLDGQVPLTNIYTSSGSQVHVSASEKVSLVTSILCCSQNFVAFLYSFIVPFFPTKALGLCGVLFVMLHRIKHTT